MLLRPVLGFQSALSWALIFPALYCIWPFSHHGCLAQHTSFDLPESEEATLGEPATLPAAYSSKYSIISITWSRVVESPAASDKRSTVFSHVPLANLSRAYGRYAGRARLVGRASLRIDPTKIEDAGTYSLSIMTGELGNEEKFIHLDILVPPTVVVGPSDPFFTTWGTSATLTCAVKDARPNITALHWEKDGGRIETRGISGKYSGGNAKIPSLTIRHVSRSDAGTYTCLVQHVTRPAAASLLMEVFYPASIISISDPKEVSLEDHVTFRCVADGNPPPNITWSKSGRPLWAHVYTISNDVRTSSLVLYSVNESSSGYYTCTASNGVGKRAEKSTNLGVLVPERQMSLTTFSTIATIIGASAGGLWLVICVTLAGYLVNRQRRKREERKKFAFYYDASLTRRSLSAEPDGKESSTNLPGKANRLTAGDRGIATMRRAQGNDRKYAKVIYDYKPREDNELKMEVGDIVEILEGEEGSWCLGYLKGRMGLFPSNYVCFVPMAEVSPATSLYIHCATDEDIKPANGNL
ncbi:nectin-4-like isoform X2 [Branchiostoma floridae x Branchiostoma belcheri]